MELEEYDSTIVIVESACLEIKSLLQNSADMEASLENMDRKFDSLQQSLTTVSTRVAPLQSQSMATKALDARINRAVLPALSLLDAFRVSESLQRKLLRLSSDLSSETKPKRRLKRLKKYVNCVNKLNLAITSVSREGEPVIQKLQEVVEFLSRTKAADQYRRHRLKETLIALKAVYETEVEAMRFDGLLDEALLNLQDEYESLLQQLKHRNIEEAQGEGATAPPDRQREMVDSDLGSELEVEVLRQISETLAANDCLDICIDIFVKVRYRRAAKALMRLNPDYLRTYRPEEIDQMEWESLETAIALWIQHFQLAVKTVFVSEKKLCNRALGSLMEGLVWPECFVKIADKIMAVFFRFGEGVARSSKEPQKLFKLLDMFDSLEKLSPNFSAIFEGQAGADICLRFRELEKLLVHSSTRVFSELGLQIESNQEGLPPPADGSVPKLVRYAINYLKYLATDAYNAPMAEVLRTEQMWKAGILSKPEAGEDILRDAISNVMEAVQRNVESQRLRYRDKVLPHVFAMNTYWYIYMRTRNSELGKLLGEPYMKKRFKIAAEESAYNYQRQAWGSLLRLLDKEDLKRANREAIRALARGKMEAFEKSFNEICQRHQSSYCIPDADLREQMREATERLIVPAYTDFVSTYSSVLQGISHPPLDSVRVSLGRIFYGSDRLGDAKLTLRRRGSRDSREINDFQRSKANASDA